MEIKRLLNISETQDLDVELQYSGVGLKVFKIVINQDTNEETLELIHSQPYKPNDDGSKSKWIDAEDAFNWFDIIKAESF